MVTRLGEADLVFKSKNLFAILAHLAVHQVFAGDDFLDAFEEGIDDHRMIVEVGCLNELDIRVAERDPIGRVVDPLDEYACE